MQFTGVIESISSATWSYVVRVPNEISNAVLSKETRRVVCDVNGLFSFQCALMPYGDGTYFINFNKENRNKIDKAGLRELQITLSVDESEYGLPFPEELKELLELDEEGNRHFHHLTKGKQRNLLHLVGKPKSEAIRIRKAIVVVDHLKEMNGKLDFKILYEALKVRK